MGVPKFFRYISERYPCLSEFVKEYQIPEFDNLYLDMNGIIHNCSHPDDGNPHFRITEEQIFADIFHYIEVLFRMIKPQKLFFMAIDGVAPRAKMNQQRGRRFRSAKDAEKLEAKAKERGEVLPTESRFDSNCITPGTVFMAKLHEQLKYFIVNKITNDKLWRGCKVILSGHETPGEGEHKIMDYIRFLKAQSGYDPNTRHCLYGLDADLIMLGLCTHEPHFSLLREEVMFGKKSTKRKSAPEQISFYLLHLSLMREYLEMEFSALKETLPFKFDIENIIDDWVLMSFLVGNDFIPHLPNMHIANGALPMLYNAYMKVLPSLEGYINEGGHLHLDRFEKFMEALESIDMDNFSEHYADLKYFEGKTGRRPNDKERTSYKPKKLEEWKADDSEDLITFETLEPEKPMRSDLAALIKATEDMFLEPSEENLDKLAADDDVDDEDVLEDIASDSGTDSSCDDLMDAEFIQHKKDYYMNKLDYKQVTPEVLRDQAECYVRAIQWNLNYYYNGVCSWGWYYPHHYAPFISDIKGFQNLDFNFNLGKPFQPYEQLLGVLPAASKALLPECYHWLMTEEKSPIKEYYPVDFATDLNGKKQDWEAVVLIPFIDEKLLLDAMNKCNHYLTPEEVKRNTHGPMLLYEYTENDNGEYEAPEYFPKIKNHHAFLTLIDIKDIRVPVEKLIKGAYPGAKTDVYYPGFPTTKHLKYKAVLEKSKVKVFDQPSRGDNMILHLEQSAVENVEPIARDLLGKTVFVAWPHLVEALVVSVSTRNYKYNKTSHPGEYNVEENHGNVAQNWDLEKSGIIGYYRDRLGIEVGDTNILVHTRPMIGRKYMFTPQGRVNLEKQWAQVTSAYPLQTIVKGILTHNKEYSAYKDISDVFVVDSYCFMLGQPHYGQMGTIMDSKESLEKGRVKMSVIVADEPNLGPVKQLAAKIRVNYMPTYLAATKLGISNHLLSRVTGTLLVILGAPRPGGIQEDASKINIGLNLKYNKKNEEIPGYTRREKGWLYSQKVVELIQEYMNLYPQLFVVLNQTTGNDIFYEYELFPEDEGSGKTIREIGDWLKKQPYNSVERQACGSEVLDPDVIKELENVVDKYVEEQPSKVVKMQVKPHLLYKPDIQMGNIAPDQNAYYCLYDRVVNVRESYTVPIGYSGTVVGIHKPASGKPEDIVYDVVFDKPFAGGLALNCSPNRGYRMSKLSLINRSHGLRQLEEKTGKPGQLLQQSTMAKQPHQQVFQQYHQNNQPQKLLPNNQPQPYHPNNQGVNYAMYQPQNSAFASWGMQNQFRPNFPFSPPAHNMPMPMRPGPPNVHADLRNPQYYQGKNLIKVDFMPRFTPPGNNRPVVQSKEDNKDTDILKKILKINGGEGDKAEGSQAKNDVHEKEGMKVSLNDMFAHAKAQNKNIPPLPKTSANSQFVYSLELSAYYQTRGFGCPQYKYFDCPDGKYCTAQLIMPFSKETVFGEPAPNRDQACENVARAMLDKLKNAGNKLEDATAGFPVKFPTPPKQWCETGNKKTKQQNSPQKSIKNGSVNENQSKRKSSESSSVPFVPLQAVRSQRTSKSGNGSEVALSDRNQQNNTNSDTKKEEVPIKEDKAKKTGGHENKPRRERKMRIAANFSIAKKGSS